MIRRVFSLVLGALLLALSFPVDAQQPAKIPRIGLLRPSRSDHAGSRSSDRRIPPGSS